MMKRSNADKYEGTINDLGGCMTVEWQPSAENPHRSTWGPFAGLCRALTPMELDTLNEALYHDPELKEQLLEAAKKSRFKRLLKED